MVKIYVLYLNRKIHKPQEKYLRGSIQECTNFEMQLQFTDTGGSRSLFNPKVTCDVSVVSFKSNTPNNLEKYSRTLESRKEEKL